MESMIIRIFFMSLLFPIFAWSESLPDLDNYEVLEEVVVWGRNESQQGTALSSSEGLVGYSDFSTRPLQRVGELVEVVPGMVATQHSGEGKANQYFLRGMNLDHGTDFSVYFEDMPVNFRSHAHGQGYLDLNFVIPEIVSTIRYAKGPYRADRGDFSTAGTASMRIYDQVEKPFIDLGIGSDGYLRSVGAASMEAFSGHLLGAVEFLRNDGPWDLSGNIQKDNLLVKYSGQHRGYDTKLLASYYTNAWNSTDQIPERLVSLGRIGRFGYVDPTLGGNSKRATLIGGIENDYLSVGGFISDYALDLFGNFTYTLEDRKNGDQHQQVDRRTIYGGHAHRVFEINNSTELNLGLDLRIDDIDHADLYGTTSRIRHKSIRQDSIDWLSVGTFAELKIHLTEKLRGHIGIRQDFYDFDVDASLQENSGSDSETHWIPSLGAAYAVNDTTEVYVNWGKGFHSNDVRGKTIRVDPITLLPVDTVDLFVDQEGAEIGIRTEPWSDLHISMTYFWLESDSELLFVGDTGSTEPSDGSKRSGFETNIFWNLSDFWTIDLLASIVDSEFKNVESHLNAIPNAHGRVIGAGITYVNLDNWTASLRIRHFGDAALTEDNSQRHESTTLFNLGISYDFGSVETGVELINLFDAQDIDIAYWYASQLPDETEPVEDIHFHPTDPFSVRASLRWKF
jgi:outer membrane receptor protein involved in Fe transport